VHGSSEIRSLGFGGPKHHVLLEPKQRLDIVLLADLQLLYVCDCNWSEEGIPTLTSVACKIAVVFGYGSLKAVALFSER